MLEDGIQITHDAHVGVLGERSSPWRMLLLMAEIRRSPVEVGSLTYYLHGFIHPRWCRISAINSSKCG